MKLRQKTPFLASVALLCGLVSATGTVSDAAPAKAAPVVTPIAAAALKKQIAARRGKVVLVNLWATWCIGCVEEFPGLVKLQKTYGPRGLSVMWVSADEMSALNGQVRPFLKSKGVQTSSYIMAEGFEHFGPRFEPTNKGAFALPRTYIFNRQGRLVSVFSSDKTYAEFEKMIKPLL